MFSKYDDISYYCLSQYLYEDRSIRAFIWYIPGREHSGGGRLRFTDAAEDTSPVTVYKLIVILSWWGRAERRCVPTCRS